MRSFHFFLFVAAILALPAQAQYKIQDGVPNAQNRGPEKALGLIIWNHGVSGNHDQSQYGVPRFIVRLHTAGWDVREIRRDAMQENNWTAAGQLHVRRTIEEASKATAQGYKRIVLAGQSYGGGITQEAAREIAVWAIIPSASGFGTSDAGTPGAGAPKTAQARTAYGETKAQRIVGIYPHHDALALGSADRGRVLRTVAEERGLVYLPLDDRSALIGHGGSSSAQMDLSYGDCVVRFLDPAFEPKRGINVCGEGGLPVGPVRLKETDTLKPADLPTHEHWGKYRGAWIGAWANPLLVSVAIERGEQGYVFTMLEGQTNSDKLGRRRSAPATLEGRNVVAQFDTTSYALIHDITSGHVGLRWQRDGKSGTLILRPDMGSAR
jgi:pimeloyl-ACP methyl ester carboxylesterase